LIKIWRDQSYWEQ